MINDDPKNLAKAYPEIELSMETIMLENIFSQKMHLLLIEIEQDTSSPQIVLQYSSGYRIKMEPIKARGSASLSWFSPMRVGEGKSPLRRMVQVKATVLNRQGHVMEEPMTVRAASPAQLLLKITMLLEAEARIRIIPIPDPVIQEDETLEIEGENQ